MRRRGDDDGPLDSECRQCGIEHPPPIGDLVQLEIRDVVDLDDNCTGFDDAGLYRRNVPAQERQILHDPRTFPGKIEKPRPVRHVRADERRARVRMMGYLLEAIRARSHRALDLPALDVELRQQIADAPEIVGGIAAGGDLPRGAQDLRSLAGRRREHSHGCQSVPAQSAYRRVWTEASLKEIAEG
jgi:hypothetical protein